MSMDQFNQEIMQASSTMKFVCKELGLDGFRTEIIAVPQQGMQRKVIVHFSKEIIASMDTMNDFVEENLNPIFDSMKGSPYFT